MSYNFSKGAQVIGDLKAADDAQRNTLIDFGEDQIDFQTSGSVRLQINNSGVTALNGAFTGSLDGTASVASKDQMGSNLVGGVWQIDDGLFQNPSTSYSKIFFPADDTFNETVGAVSTNYKMAPFDGELIKIQVRSTSSFEGKSLTASLHVGSGLDNAYDSTASVSVAVTGSVPHTLYVFDFMGLSGTTFSENDIFGFSLELSQNWAGNETVHFTTTVRFDPYG